MIGGIPAMRPRPPMARPGDDRPRSDADNTEMSQELILLMAIGFTVGTAALANSKGRSPVTWGILGFLFGIFALIVCAILPNRKPAY